ncbi:hypothetical protein [Pseudoalteromonas luteoviolacea]|uniref:hypothetical protein n=1 Tax=Pseudoalteromonas luteoviolacea TaxID=43657 RepID=UPI00114EF6CA|nr:hypothetical protein [Pseudoalteromonas luteoviolacea]TQF69568.1 hypothetical protein FLM44_00175 [Pseudoalteromonas luteoviolacea]
MNNKQFETLDSTTVKLVAAGNGSGNDPITSQTRSTISLESLKLVSGGSVGGGGGGEPQQSVARVFDLDLRKDRNYLP